MFVGVGESADFSSVTLLTMSIRAPSPATFTAVPIESRAMLSVIMSAIMGSENPNIDWMRPAAAMMTPPGMPGAASTVMEKIMMKLRKSPKE